MTSSTLPVCFLNLSPALAFVFVHGMLNVNSLFLDLFDGIPVSHMACRPAPANTIEFR
jgi:hypothetical protein